MTDDRTCPTCGERAPTGANWCEACGSELDAAPAAVCVACQRPGIDDDGYCMSCGHKQPDPRDHHELTVGAAAAVTDRGLRHHHNEDAVALGSLPGGAVLVVCDGVSSTAGSASASEAAAAAAVAHLVGVLGPGSDNQATDHHGPDDAAIAVALQEATVAAQDAAEGVAGSVSDEKRASARQHGPPSSTFVAAVALERPEGLHLAVAWLGDSRAYWIDDHGASLLTRDHEVNGSLVRWLGADSGRPPPDLTAHTVTTAGRVLLCSDGLWRYADPPSELTALLRRLESEGAVDDLELARRLTDHALAGGGHDNISVAAWSRPGSSATDGSQPREGIQQTS